MTPPSSLARPVPLGRRSVLALALTSLVGAAGFGWPLLASARSALVGHSADAPWLFALLLPLLLAVVVAQISEGRTAGGGAPDSTPSPSRSSACSRPPAPPCARSARARPDWSRCSS
nr:hypothetical protein KPHV_27800 [Kitasatospora purpeofusca]